MQQKPFDLYVGPDSDTGILATETIEQILESRHYQIDEVAIVDGHWYGFPEETYYARIYDTEVAVAETAELLVKELGPVAVLLVEPE